jgi:hypothetical protein
MDNRSLSAAAPTTDRPISVRTIREADFASDRSNVAQGNFTQTTLVRTKNR